MDWSLIDPYAHYRLLRDHLAFKRIWMYYVAMIIDPILRFNWIFYAIYADDVQHSAILSFIIALSEVCRRGIWVIFRVENEHCTNVGRFRASRDVPLPYKIRRRTEAAAPLAEGGGALPEEYEDEEEDEARAAREEEQLRQGVSISPSLSRTQSSGVELSRQRTQDSESGTIRPRRPRKHSAVEPSPLTRGLNYVGGLLHTAHAQDFERKKRPPAVEDKDGEGDKSDSDDDDDEDDDPGTDRSEAEREEEEAERISEEIEDEAGGPSASGSVGKEVFSFHPRRLHDDGDEDEEGVQVESLSEGEGVQSPSGTVRRSKKKADMEE
jgi:hypothetical protein